ncbi:hypothetical protein [Nonomuraea typhae]|uniref:hypothetical protein n=1 Tax=Nonomuraea typhae TaxID=2603600 RepID=UPI0012FCE1A4|nr:hypothetical protein [Nonomuraea typhae]
MFKTYELGKLYFQFLRMNKIGPIIELAPTQEVDFPFRVGRCAILRLPLTTRALAIGIWTGTEPDEDSAMLRALQAHMEHALSDDGTLLDRFQRPNRITADPDSERPQADAE